MKLLSDSVKNMFKVLIYFQIFPQKDSASWNSIQKNINVPISMYLRQY